MKMFIFEDLEQVSDRYHSDGGLVVIARDKVEVEELIAKVGNIEITDGEWETAVILELSHDIKPQVFVFPDAGCC